MENNYEIAALPKEQWKEKPIPLTTRSDSYYDFEIDPLNADGCTVKIIKKQAEEEIIHTPEEYDFPDSLYQDHRKKSCSAPYRKLRKTWRKLSRRWTSSMQPSGVMRCWLCRNAWGKNEWVAFFRFFNGNLVFFAFLQMLII